VVSPLRTLEPRCRRTARRAWRGGRSRHDLAAWWFEPVDRHVTDLNCRPPRGLGHFHGVITWHRHTGRSRHSSPVTGWPSARSRSRL
jgi:hypothetical protein